ncbi:MAG: methyltransferase [Betaproteobacteria bacterium]|nr:methyltransferase [Betaproteobacteria bacterium]
MDQRDHCYYEVVKPGSIAEWLVMRARRQIYEDFKKTMRPEASASILDVGVSDVVQGADNIIERLHPYTSQITAVGLGEGGEFRQTFPAIKYSQIAAGSRLPFDDGEFAISTANAVLEHVGSTDSQKYFVIELIRVAREVFISIPNRYFPVEHHTAIPFAGWNDASFKLACRALGKEYWADSQNLILMSVSRLKCILPQSHKWRIGFTGIRFGPFSSNIYAYTSMRIA